MNAVIIAAAIYLANGGCVQAPRDHIFLNDIAGAIPALGSMAQSPDPVAWTPAPGARRVITAKELLQAARLNGVSISADDVHDVCVERATSPLTASQIEQALSRVPELYGADIEIEDFSRVRVPDGRPEFNIAAAPRPVKTESQDAVLWRGRFVYDERRSIPIWIRVKLSRPVTLVRAVSNIPVGAEVSAAMVELTSAREFPTLGDHHVSTTTEAVGKRTVRAVHAGDALDRRWLGELELISPGQPVRVTVESGGVRLTMDREAASAGKLGQMVLLRDRTGRTLRAETAGRGIAIVRVPTEKQI